MDHQVYVRIALFTEYEKNVPMLLPLGDIEVLEELAEDRRLRVALLMQYEDRIQHSCSRIDLIQRRLWY